MNSRRFVLAFAPATRRLFEEMLISAPGASRSFGTKIDTLARHILWIRQNDPGAKSVIFSQYKDFLNVLGRAFAQFKIAFSGFDKPNGVRKFKDDPGVCVLHDCDYRY